MVFAVCAGVIALVATATSARANEMAGAFLVMGIVLMALAIPFLLAYTAVVALIEAWALGAILKLGFRRSFWCSLLANVASGAVGLVWYWAGGPAGWKETMTERQWGPMTVAFLRSFVVTVVVEGFVLWLMLRRSREVAGLAKATVAMNALSYGVTAVVMIIGMLSVAASK